MPDTETLLSHFYVEVEGMDESMMAELMDDLVSVNVESSLHLPDVATLVLHDTRLRWVDEARLEPGNGLKVSARTNTKERPLFDGEIIELEPEFGAGVQRLTLRAFDRLHRLARGRHVRSFINLSEGDLVEKIAREAGLRAKVGPASEVHSYLFQNNETNLGFLQGRAAGLGYLLYVDGETLHFVPPAAEDAPIELQWAQTLHEFRPRLTTVDQISNSTVRGWDPITRQEIVGAAGNGQGAPEIGDGRDGGQLAQSAFGIEASHLTADRPVRSQVVADQRAQAVANRHASRFVEADGTCTGDTRIVAGVPLRIAAVGDRFTGTYLVTGARHVYDRDAGYTTYFSVTGQNPSTLLALLAPERPPAAMPGLVIGIVTDNQDPDGLGRVKVTYPWLSPDHASDWARVVAPGAGDARGIEFLPEINDEVLVGFEQGDVHYPYVLGGLWNGIDKPPGDQSEVVEGGKVRQRIVRTRAGHSIILDDADGGGGITIEDRNGNTIALDSRTDALRIDARGDISLEARGNLKLSARGKVEINGMGVSVEGSAGTVDVKGSLIRLN